MCLRTSHRIPSFCEARSRNTPALSYLLSIPSNPISSFCHLFRPGYSSRRSLEASTTRKRTNGWAEWTDYDRITQARPGFSMSVDLLTSFKSFQPYYFVPMNVSTSRIIFTCDLRCESEAFLRMYDYALRKTRINVTMTWLDIGISKDLKIPLDIYFYDDNKREDKENF